LPAIEGRSKEGHMSLPRAEYEERIRRVRNLAAEKDLDFIFVYFDEFNVTNGRYLTGWCPSVERGAVIVSGYCEPFLVGGPEAGPFARLESMIKETVSSLVFMVPEEEYPGADLYTFPQIADRYFKGRKIHQVGVVGMNAIPWMIYSQLIEELPGADVVNVTDEFERLRYVKSPWEIEMIQEAYRAADAGFQKLSDAIVDGRREYEAAAEAEYACRRLGCDGWGYRTIIGTAERSVGIIPAASDRVFRTGEIVITGLAPRFNGYNATACAPCVVGNQPNDVQQRWIRDVTEALFLTRDAIRPGLTGTQIDAVPRGFLERKGYGPYMPMPFVHSTGLFEYEKPFFGPSSPDVIAEDMVLCIDIAMFGAPEVPGIRAETGYRVTRDGAVALSPFMEGIFKG
jgi:Xaa-Pro aminopeptidase